MNIFYKKILLPLVLILLISCDSPGGNENTIISIQTTLGDIKIKLYDGTPLHRDNFIRLLKSGFYDGISFHRVIQDFMIQAGDPQTKPVPDIQLPDSLRNYKIPAEFISEYFHKKGALAAARQGNNVNPEMKSSWSQFYIIQGVIQTDEELDLAEQHINNNIKQALFYRIMKETADSVRLSGNTISDGEIQEISSVKMFQYLTINKDFTFSEDQRNVYKSIGGIPRLDGTYTVFGEVIEGLDIVDQIAAVQTDSFDKPVFDIKIVKIKTVRK